MMDTLLNILKGVAPTLATAVAGPAGGMAVGWIAEKLGIPDSTIEGVTAALTGNPEMALKLKELDLEYAKVDAADRDSARKMQIVALQQDDLFSKRFNYYFATGWSAFSMVYFVLVTFVDLPDDGVNFANIILGFLLGTAIAAIFNFYFGSSQGSKDKTKEIEGMLKK
jgi:hypothetical protein